MYIKKESGEKMVRYSDQILEDVRQSNDIVNIISQYLLVYMCLFLLSVR